MPEPFLERVKPEAMPDDLRSAWSASMALRGDATFFEVFANHPDLYRWYAQGFYGEVFRKGLVEQRFKELLRLRLSTLHGCRFCNQGNREDARAAGLSVAGASGLRPAPCRRAPVVRLTSTPAPLPMLLPAPS